MLWAFRDRILDLKKDRRFKYILIFKNHGEAAGASLEHSHSQLIALPILPIYVVEELEGAKQYYIYKERCVFCDIIRQELENAVRAWSRERRLSSPWRRTRRAFRLKPGFCPSGTNRLLRIRLRRCTQNLAKVAEDAADERRPRAR